METENQKQMDRELLIRLDEKVGLFLNEFKNFTGQINDKLKALQDEKASAVVQRDHESRMRRLEYAYILGAGILIAVEFYFKFFHGK